MWIWLCNGCHSHNIGHIAGVVPLQGGGLHHWRLWPVSTAHHRPWCCGGLISMEAVAAAVAPERLVILQAFIYMARVSASGWDAG